MDEAMPDNASSTDEPHHHSDSENEILSLEEEEVIAQVGHLGPDDVNEMSSPADAGGGDDEDVDNDAQDAASDYGPASPDEETSDIEQASQGSDVDAGQGDLSQGEFVEDGLSEVDEQNPVQSPSDFDDALLDEGNAEEGRTDNLDGDAMDGDVLGDTESQDKDVDRPEQQIDASEGPASPDQEGPISPAAESTSDVENPPDDNDSDKSKVSQGPSSPTEQDSRGPEADISPPSESLPDNDTITTTYPDNDPPGTDDKEAAITNSESRIDGSDNADVADSSRTLHSQQEEENEGEISEVPEEKGHGDLKCPLEADNAADIDDGEEGEMVSDSDDLVSPSLTTENLSTQNVEKPAAADSVDQSLDKSSKSVEQNIPVSDASVPSESVVNDNGKSKKVNDKSNAFDNNMGISSSSSKGGLHDDHGELDYYEDVDDVHLDCPKKMDGEFETTEGEINKGEQEEGMIDQDGDEGEIVDGDDKTDEEGELDDEDCEEGEIKDPDGRKPFVPPVCRFYNRGHCTWGNNCRFLHPGVNDKGNYSLIERANVGQNHGGLHGRLGPWGGHQEENNFENELPPPPEEPVVESAWERGLRHAKELMKKANKRKETDTNFEEKKMTLSLEEDRDQNKENDYKRYPKDPYYDQHMYEEEELENNAYPLQTWHQGHYENFEVRWTRDGEHGGAQSQLPGAYRDRERDHIHMRDPREMMEQRDIYHYRSPDRERYDRKPNHRHHHHNRHNDHHHQERPRPRPQERPYERSSPPLKSSIRDERAERAMMPPSAIRSDEWRDPWRRSKSPKVRRESFSRSRSRGRRRRRSYSRGSYSSSSSSSRSSRSRSSSFSSYTSRSSYSRSSSYSSRSRSRSPGAPRPGRKSGQNPAIGSTNQKKIPPKPGDPPVVSKDGPNKRKPGLPPGDKAPLGPGRGIPKTHAERGRKLQRDPPGAPGRVRRKTSAASSSGSSLSRSRSRSSSSSRSRSYSGSSRSSRSSSLSSSSSGSADSVHLYRDMDNPGQDKASKQASLSPKKKIAKSGDKTVKNRKEDVKRPPRTDKQKIRDDQDRARERKAPPNKTQTKANPKAPPRPPNVQGRPPPNVQGRPSNSASRQPPMQGGPVPRGQPLGANRAGPNSSAKADSSKTSKMPTEKQMPTEMRAPVDSRQPKSTVPPSKTKDPLKLSGQKPSIKLTLLNKPPAEKTNPLSHNNAGTKKRAAPNVSSSPPPAKRQAKTTSPPPKPAPDKERKGVKLTLSKSDKGPQSAATAATKTKPEEKPAKAAPVASAKKPESPQKPAPKMPAPVAAAPKQKKSTSSRREELLKQLKAVEDAIARKRAKMN